ncbi:transcriptional regulator [Pseudooceanicola sediminis]|uniref:Transcriptional regulator n=1 Tax=Pseudooceanicola sediminis TaxID=2211117 RepID=A0A399J0X0_9RHOB|nr:ChrR family anti-sigma-E factor [Pseudooceanicola sediminis]KAA2313424.1 transcriptional regulator [Puniceibacterium sp. HSS470]RII38297.1 transcriptional regulator [Pseudooceanicola sediminis]|tara:strand:- start:5633 stop:6271 length:639 start_codon:yes stop_codon:yes gene_type:complete
MSAIAHHIPEQMIAGYVSGTLPPAFEMVVAAHVSMCDACRAALEAHETLAGALLEATTQEQPIENDLLSRVMDRLDAPAAPAPQVRRMDIYPGPVAAALDHKPPRWRAAGGGVRQQILFEDGKGSVRLLYIPGGMAVPDHGHRGTELTMVLSGAFHDETGQFGVGDVEVADESLEHTPTADAGEPCICLAATDARLRFNSILPRLAQPFLRI